MHVKKKINKKGDIYKGISNKHRSRKGITKMPNCKSKYQTGKVFMLL